MWKRAVAAKWVPGLTLGLGLAHEVGGPGRGEVGGEGRVGRSEVDGEGRVGRGEVDGKGRVGRGQVGGEVGGLTLALSLFLFVFFFKFSRFLFRLVMCTKTKITN